jgi:glycosyltransferase involved in cell wall biosynthesis
MGMQRKLKVAWDNCFARQNEAGTGVYAAGLLGQLLQSSGLELKVMNGWSLGSPATFLSRIIRTSADLFWTHAYIPTYLGMHAFDLLHSPAFIAPVKAPCPVVITIHDITYLLFPSHFPSWWRAYMKMVMPRVAKAAAAIICGSEYSKRDIVRAYGIIPGKVHVIPYGVDHERFHPHAVLPRTWAEALGITDGYVLHVGALSYRKNIPTLLRAIHRLRSKGSWRDRQLVLAGSEAPGLSGASEIYAAIRELELSNVVILAGRIPGENLPGLYAHASLLVMPSLYEGFGFPVVEGMAAGTPVVVSNNSSLSEVVGDAGLLFPPEHDQALADAIERVLHSPSTAKELGRKGLERSRQFTWQRTATETLRVYQTVAFDSSGR